MSLDYNIFNPIVGQSYFTRKLLGEGVDIVDPTNPFVMLLEANVVSTYNAMDAMVRNDRNIYPYLARSDDDLYHHMTSEEEIHMYATPANTDFRLYIQLNDIISYGVDTDNKGKHLVIPTDTVINISGYDFRVQYDIHIKIIDNTPFIYQDISSNKDGVETSNVVIRSGVVRLTDSIDWVVFDLNTPQVSLVVNQLQLVRNVRITKKVFLEEDDQYYRSVCYYNSNKGRVYLDVVHLDTVVNVDKPTISCRIKDGYIEYSIPAYYIENGMLPNTIYIKTYTTKGKMFFNVPTETIDIKVDTSNVRTDTPYKAAGVRVNIIPELLDPIDGGTNMRDFRVRRNKVIHNTTGINELPITERELLEAGRSDGFKLTIAKDTILSRILLASKTDHVTIYERNIMPDILFNSIYLTVSSVSNTNIIVGTDGTIIIPNNTVFKYDGGFTPLTKEESYELDNKGNTDLIKHYQTNKLYTSIYTYTLYTSDDTFACEVYNIETPTVSDTFISSMNVNVPEKVSTFKPIIISNKDGYVIKAKLLIDNTEDVDKASKIRSMLSIPMYNNSGNIYIEGTIDENNVITYIIPSNRQPKRNTIMVSGKDVYGISITKAVDLDCKIGIINFTKNNKLIDDQYTATLYPLLNKDSLALTLEYMNVKLGIALEHIHTNMKSGFTNRKFSTYPIDIVDVYGSDVFKEVDGSQIILTKDQAGNTIDANVITLHKQGDVIYEVVRDALGNPILDANGDTQPVYKTDSDGTIMTEEITNADGSTSIVSVRLPVYKHKQGDVIYNENNKPVIDKLGGISYRFNMLMIDTMFFTTNSYDSSNIDFKKNLVTKWISKDLDKLNDRILEQTKILLHPIKNTGPVYITGSRVLNHSVKPSIIIHTRNKLDVSLSINDLIREVGVIFSRYVSKNIIELNKIRDTIIKDIPGNITGVTINMNDGLNLEVYSLEDNSNRMSLAYKLDNRGNIVYDLDVTVEIA